MAGAVPESKFPRANLCNQALIRIALQVCGGFCTQENRKSYAPQEPACKLETTEQGLQRPEEDDCNVEFCQRSVRVEFSDMQGLQKHIIHSSFLGNLLEMLLY